ncbi:MAG: tetraacyldisaccharide 4'-kinase [Bacteroidia bacterium]|nr:tetraacyldisaccharide 4'-kinase [Bacteroidia bacterium]MCZ2249413.1 tetraacyldisaccharide 4'-kinase [Bacteroidia bacterium]
MIHILRILLYPIAVLYGLIIAFRNFLYDNKLLYIAYPKVKTILVGNLSTGGTGKTPHIEYLIRLLSNQFRVATLSRGYGRKKRGFRIATLQDNSETIGDEPFQYFQNFINIIVAVDKYRSRGIKKLQKLYPDLQLILLDDGFQHRSVKAGLQIVLTDFSSMYYDDAMLPTGNLREFKQGIRRADIIIVSKTPPIFSPIERRYITSRINPLSHQKLFFSYIKYTSLVHYFDKAAYSENEFNQVLTKETSVIVFAGIANPSLLEDFARSKSRSYTLMVFDDHHHYNLNDLQKIKASFDALIGNKKIILTTEKDAMRLLHLNLPSEWKKLPLYYAKIEVMLHKQDEENFNQTIINYVGTN